MYIACDFNYAYYALNLNTAGRSLIQRLHVLRSSTDLIPHVTTKLYH